MFHRRYRLVVRVIFKSADSLNNNSGYAKMSTMQWAKNQKNGFTIVELLIVVVVIAILASITIVSYNGITERARVAGGKSFAAQLLRRDIAQANGYWGFNECSGNTIANTGGNAAAATNTILGAANYSVDTPNGSGCSWNMSNNSFITNIALSNTYYMKSAWIKTSSASTAMNIMSDATTSNSAFYLNAYKLSTGHNSSWTSVQGSASLNDGKWHFVAVEFTQNANGTSGTLVMSVDGAVVKTDPNILIMTNVANSFQQIGAFNSTSYYTGLMDDVMIVVK